MTTLSDVYLRRREWENAADACRRAVSLSPDNPIPYFNLGRAYLHTGQAAEAEKAYRDAVARIQPADRWMLDSAMGELQQDAVTYPELTAAVERMLGIIRAARQ